MTSSNLRSALISTSGSPSTAMTSARYPLTKFPMSAICSASAARLVALTIASLVDWPAATRRSNSIAVSPDGTVSATVPGEAEPTELGQIQVARFTNPAGLQAIGDNFLVETAASGAAELAPAGENGRGNIRQGMLEASNVNIVEELVEMIEAQRAYEISSNMVSAVDEMLRNANQTL